MALGRLTRTGGVFWVIMSTADHDGRTASEHFDVLIIGAGLSGIGAARYLQDKCPGKSFAILESRHAIGGTWDLFRYPGIRSDSDMYTMGYRFKPWTAANAIADGTLIREYIREAAREGSLDKHIRLDHQVVAASWSTPSATWRVAVRGEGSDDQQSLTCNFLMMCSGYYNYEAGYTPDFANRTDFAGPIIHPQHWPDDLDFSGKRIVLIGSGATAVTLVPALARSAAQVTMVQRSPTYLASVPRRDVLAERLRRHVPESIAYRVARARNIGFQILTYELCRTAPGMARGYLLDRVERHLTGASAMENFTPTYEPWDERLCAVPDGDFFAAIRAGTASVVTATIERFTPDGVMLRDGRELPADIIVTATGLDLALGGGVSIDVDGQPFDMASAMTYKGMMFADVPNLSITTGYTNASWTLKSDLVAGYVCRLINHMQRTGTRQCTPRQKDPSVRRVPLMELKSGYVRRAQDKLPQQGNKRPWRLCRNYLLDSLFLRCSSVDDKVMEFSDPARGPTIVP